MSLCVVTESDPLNPEIQNLVLSTAIPCDGYLLLAETDIENHMTKVEVGLLFSAACGLYALAYIIKMARCQIGYK